MRLTINNIPDTFRYADLVTEELGFGIMSGAVEVGDEYTIGTETGWGRAGIDHNGQPKFVVTDDSEPERPPLKLWQVTGHVILTRVIDGEEWTRKRPIPVFYLDEQASGITDKEHAVTIAGDIVLRSIVKLDSSVVLDLHVFPIAYKLDRDQS